MSGLLRSKVGELWRRLVQKRELVGIDAHLNKYYIWHQKDYKGDFQERREVQLFAPPTEMASYDPNAIPTEWRSWLAGHRRVPPSPEEAKRLQEYREKVRANAQLAESGQGPAGSSHRSIGAAEGPSMDAFLHQLGSKEDATRDKQHDSSVPEGSQNEQESQGGEASGEGDTFKPGQWTPGGS